MRAKDLQVFTTFMYACGNWNEAGIDRLIEAAQNGDLDIKDHLKEKGIEFHSF